MWGTHCNPLSDVPPRAECCKHPVRRHIAPVPPWVHRRARARTHHRNEESPANANVVGRLGQVLYVAEGLVHLQPRVPLPVPSQKTYKPTRWPPHQGELPDRRDVQDGRSVPEGGAPSPLTFPGSHAADAGSLAEQPPCWECSVSISRFFLPKRANLLILNLSKKEDSKCENCLGGRITSARRTYRPCAGGNQQSYCVWQAALLPSDPSWGPTNTEKSVQSHKDLRPGPAGQRKRPGLGSLSTSN